MPKYERKQILNKIQAPTAQRFPYQMPMQIPVPHPGPYTMPPYPNMTFPRPGPHRHPYRKPQKPQVPPQEPQIQPNPPSNNNVSSTKEDEPNYRYLESLENDEAKKDYLGEYLFKKIEQHPIAQSKNLTVETISRITGMILGIGDIKEIFEITVNYDSITARINEALSLLEQQ